jgi:glycogen debranching enzyme
MMWEDAGKDLDSKNESWKKDPTDSNKTKFGNAVIVYRAAVKRYLKLLSRDKKRADRLASRFERKFVHRGRSKTDLFQRWQDYANLSKDIADEIAEVEQDLAKVEKACPAVFPRTGIKNGSS